MAIRVASNWPRSAVLFGLLFPLWLTMACVFVLPRTSHAQTFTTLYTFTGNTDGGSPSGLIEGKAATFYGTSGGGALGYGTVFSITSQGKLTTLYTFTGGTDGAYPNALIEAKSGDLYGTTQGGGAAADGTVFNMTTAGALTSLYSFSGVATDGAAPHAGVIQGKDGNFYGTTLSGGGANNFGTVFRITTASTLTTLHSFGGTDGVDPYAGLTQANDGNFYGTTNEGGAYNYGDVFKITSSGSFAAVYSFTGSLDGANPYAGLIQGKDGALYGTTTNAGANGTGTVFKITTGGTFKTLYTFSAVSSTGTNSDGANPFAGLVQATDGNLYGVTGSGGANAFGTVYKITTGGTFTTLYTFSALSITATNADGAYPNALIQASDGNLYGTTVGGGADGQGTVFTLNVGLSVLTGLSPSTADAAGPPFSITITGTDFASSSTVNWTQGSTTTPLTITFVSSTRIKATVPASLIARAGKVTVTVVDPVTRISKSKPFTILVTTLNLLSAKLTKTSTGSYTAKISIENVGYLTAPKVTITKSSLGAAATSSTLPLSIANIAAGTAGSTSLTFPGSAGSSGTWVVLTVKGTFTGGTFTGSLKVKLP